MRRRARRDRESVTLGLTATAVDSFSKLHEGHELPANERYYRDLIPLSQPGPGEQYAFEVDLDACTGCKSCVVACHSLNGLDEDESWRSVGTLQGGGKLAFQQTVTTACHHCVDPACLTGCPVNAYEKDAVTGIVSHLDDQCIGCSYCTLTCPYEVPRFNEAKGIVRKCDMCRGRLEVGEAPACVQSCPNGAIRISIVSKAEATVAATAADAALVPGAPASAITVPTTRYRTKRDWPADATAVDHLSLRPAHPHPPLAAMLVLTQLAVGALAADVAFRAGLFGRLGAAARPVHAAVIAAVAVAAMAASTLHLGRPRYAFRAVLGIGHSWLSREVVAFGAFAAMATGYAVAVTTSPGRWFTSVLGGAALAAGGAGVACSVMLYAVTRRAFWRARRTAPLFLLSGAATGLLATVATTSVLAAFVPGLRDEAAVQIRMLAVAVAALTMAKLVADVAPFRHLRDADENDHRRSALLLRRDLWLPMQVRLFVGALGGVVLPVILAATTSATAPSPSVAVTACVALVLLVGGELLERHHFFRVAVAPRMPGELR